MQAATELPDALLLLRLRGAAALLALVQAEALTRNLAEGSASENVRAGRTDKAVEVVAEGKVAAAPRKKRARALDAQLLLRTKPFADALQAAAAAFQTTPRTRTSSISVAPRRSPCASWARPSRTWRRALEMAPRHTAATNDLAVVTMTQNKPGEAEKLLEQVLALNPNDQTVKASLENLKKMAAGKGKGQQLSPPVPSPGPPSTPTPGEG